MIRVSTVMLCVAVGAVSPVFADDDAGTGARPTPKGIAPALDGGVRPSGGSTPSSPGSTPAGPTAAAPRAGRGIANAELGAPAPTVDPAKARIDAVFANILPGELRTEIEDAFRRGGPIVTDATGRSVADAKPLAGSTPFRLPLPVEDSRELVEAATDWKARNPDASIAELVPPGVPADPARARIQSVLRSLGGGAEGRAIEKALRDGVPLVFDQTGRPIADGSPKAGANPIRISIFNEDAHEIIDALEDFKARNPGARFAELVTPHDPNRDLGDRLTRALSSLSENDRATVREFYGAEGANPFASPAGAARLARAIAEVNARHPDVLRNFGAVAQELRSRAPNEQFRNLVARSAARDRLR